MFVEIMVGVGGRRISDCPYQTLLPVLNYITDRAYHCIKSVQVRSIFWFIFFPLFSPNTGKHGPENTPYWDTFHAVC